MIGDYIVQQELGEGSFGVVKLARHQLTSRKVAIKIASREEIQKEYDLLSSLDHSHIIRVSKYISHVPFNIRTKNTHEQAFIMDYLEGGDLVDLLGREGGRLSQKKAMKFLDQLLSAVSYLHQHGITHRDIKPDNLLFDAKSENLVLADFGLAEFCGPKNFLTGSAGSLVYCAPEALRGFQNGGSQLDIWSVGVVFYCMLTGCIPWSGDNIHQQLKNAVKGRFCKMSCISSECERLIASMLTVDPKNRPTADQLLQQLGQISYAHSSKLRISMHRRKTC